MAAATVPHPITCAVRALVESGRDNRLLYDHPPAGLDRASPKEIIATFRQLVREGAIERFITCEDGIVWPKATQEVRQ